ncbi:MAG TPA: HigA family addiction module antitoxin [Longimicrobium sp.]|jgi:addiction module HigA family antidote|nr:HigA family addiction module antitoxin [Longimicrobium sp.]
MSRLPTHRAPLHPGEILLEEFIKPHGLTLTEAARRLRIERVRLSEIVNGRRGVTPNTALRLERLFGASAAFWLGMQQDYDIWSELHSSSATDVEKIEPLNEAA